MSGAAGPDFVIAIVNLIPPVDGEGSARLLGIVPDRSTDALSGLARSRGRTFRHRICVVTMERFDGYAKAATQHLSPNRPVTDPFHAVHLAIDKLTACR